ncbi:MAG: hypothetical protein ACLR5H_07260 [Oscillospiraceae bacterium]
MTLTMPPAPSGSPQQMAMAQYAYLFQMAQQLNLALGQLETGGAGTSSSGGGTAGGGDRKGQPGLSGAEVHDRENRGACEAADGPAVRQAGGANMWRCRISGTCVWSG